MSAARKECSSVCEQRRVARQAHSPTWTGVLEREGFHISKDLEAQPVQSLAACDSVQSVPRDSVKRVSPHALFRQSRWAHGPALPSMRTLPCTQKPAAFEQSSVLGGKVCAAAARRTCAACYAQPTHKVCAGAARRTCAACCAQPKHKVCAVAAGRHVRIRCAQPMHSPRTRTTNPRASLGLPFKSTLPVSSACGWSGRGQGRRSACTRARMQAQLPATQACMHACCLPPKQGHRATQAGGQCRARQQHAGAGGYCWALSPVHTQRDHGSWRLHRAHIRGRGARDTPPHMRPGTGKGLLACHLHPRVAAQTPNTHERAQGRQPHPCALQQQRSHPTTQHAQEA